MEIEKEKSPELLQKSNVHSSRNSTYRKKSPELAQLWEDVHEKAVEEAVKERRDAGRSIKGHAFSAFSARKARETYIERLEQEFLILTDRNQHLKRTLRENNLLHPNQLNCPVPNKNHTACVPIDSSVDLELMNISMTHEYQLPEINSERVKGEFSSADQKGSANVDMVFSDVKRNPSDVVPERNLPQSMAESGSHFTYMQNYVERTRLAASFGDLKAHISLANTLQFGVIGEIVQKDIFAAYLLYKKASECFCDPSASISYANILINCDIPDKIPKDIRKALSVLSKAVLHGSIEASVNMGVLQYFFNLQEYSEAINYFLSAAEKGNKEGILNLSICLHHYQRKPSTNLEEMSFDLLRLAWPSRDDFTRQWLVMYMDLPQKRTQPIPVTLQHGKVLKLNYLNTLVTRFQNLFEMDENTTSDTLLENKLMERAFEWLEAEKNTILERNEGEQYLYGTWGDLLTGLKTGIYSNCFFGGSGDKASFVDSEMARFAGFQVLSAGSKTFLSWKGFAREVCVNPGSWVLHTFGPLHELKLDADMQLQNLDPVWSIAGKIPRVENYIDKYEQRTAEFEDISEHNLFDKIFAKKHPVPSPGTYTMVFGEEKLQFKGYVPCKIINVAAFRPTGLVIEKRTIQRKRLQEGTIDSKRGATLRVADEEECTGYHVSEPILDPVEELSKIFSSARCGKHTNYCLTAREMAMVHVICGCQRQVMAPSLTGPALCPLRICPHHIHTLPQIQGFSLAMKGPLTLKVLVASGYSFQEEQLQNWQGECVDMRHLALTKNMEIPLPMDERRLDHMLVCKHHLRNVKF